MTPNPNEKNLNLIRGTGPLDESDSVINHFPQSSLKPGDRQLQIVWINVANFALWHSAALYGFYLLFAGAAWKTILFGILNLELGMFGVTAGAHRLWAHRSYKAKLPLKVILVFCQTLAFQLSVIDWVKEHRSHHKFQETDADPHNANRGFFFAHVGWLLCKRHPDVKAKGQTLDLSDLHADPLLRFQHKYMKILMAIITFTLPTLIPMYFWNESFVNSFCVNVLRHISCLHFTWLVNSVAHWYGSKPYDKHINPVENRFVTFITLGEGWHNYHHTFPWDYKTAELGKLNITLFLIDQFAKIGWAYDLKTASPEMIKNRAVKTGDGSHEIWGWGDKDQSKEDYENALILNKKL